jgi:hypothetical protein
LRAATATLTGAAAGAAGGAGLEHAARREIRVAAQTRRIAGRSRMGMRERLIILSKLSPIEVLSLVFLK